MANSGYREVIAALVTIIVAMPMSCSSSTASVANDTLLGSWVGTVVDSTSIVDSLTFDESGRNAGFRRYQGTYIDHRNGNGSGIATAKRDPSGSFVELQFGGYEIQGNFTDPNTVVGAITLAALAHTYRLNRIR
jgi:hypothetical protein